MMWPSLLDFTRQEVSLQLVAVSALQHPPGDKHLRRSLNMMLCILPLHGVLQCAVERNSVQQVCSWFLCRRNEPLPLRGEGLSFSRNDDMERCMFCSDLCSRNLKSVLQRHAVLCTKGVWDPGLPFMISNVFPSGRSVEELQALQSSEGQGIVETSDKELLEKECAPSSDASCFRCVPCTIVDSPSWKRVVPRLPAAVEVLSWFAMAVSIRTRELFINNSKPSQDCFFRFVALPLDSTIEDDVTEPLVGSLPGRSCVLALQLSRGVHQIFRHSAKLSLLMKLPQHYLTQTRDIFDEKVFPTLKLAMFSGECSTCSVDRLSGDAQVLCLVAFLLMAADLGGDKLSVSVNEHLTDLAQILDALEFCTHQQCGAPRDDVICRFVEMLHESW